MIKCEIDMKTGHKKVSLKGKIPTIFTELEELIRGIRETMESENVSEEIQNKLFETAFEKAKLSQKDSVLRTMEKVELPNFFKEFVKDLLDKADEE